MHDPIIRRGVACFLAAGSRTLYREPSGSSSLMRGMARGLLKGMIGGMIFGRPAHGGMGGFGGSGIGLIEILLLGGLARFVFKRFLRPVNARPSAGAYHQGAPYPTFYACARPYDDGPMPDIAPASGFSLGIEAVRRSDRHFNPALFLEGAQDVFFKIQAAWMRQNLSLVEGLIGNDLAAAYRRQMEEMKGRGAVNRLENTAVRSVEIIDAGVEGEPATPVKFGKNWTFTAPEGTSGWKLEGIG